MTKDCAECEGAGSVTQYCDNCSALGQRYEGVGCHPCRGTGEFTHKCEAMGCRGGQVEEDDPEPEDVRETEAYKQQMEVGLGVLRDYPVTLTKLSEEGQVDEE